MMDNDGVDVEFGNRWRLDRRGMFRATTSAEGDGTLVKKNGVATAGNRKEEDSVVARREREREEKRGRPAGHRLGIPRQFALQLYSCEEEFKLLAKQVCPTTKEEKEHHRRIFSFFNDRWRTERGRKK
jgi:hypothetical protein